MSKAFATLGLPDTAAPDEVKAKWRELCMIHHPDRGGNPVEFDEVRRAYKAAMAKASEPKPCNTCSGTGKIKQTSGWSSIDMPCQACGGSGHA
jgi:DnaJ-class molecular chaperone